MMQGTIGSTSVFGSVAESYSMLPVEEDAEGAKTGGDESGGADVFLVGWVANFFFLVRRVDSGTDGRKVFARFLL